MTYAPSASSISRSRGTPLIRRLVVLSALVLAGLPAATATAAPAAPTVSVSASPTLIYPARDGYLDATTVSASVDTLTTASAQVVTSTGSPVKTLPTSGTGLEHSFTWNGTDDSGAVVRAGTYAVIVTATDAESQTATDQVAITVRPEKLTWVTWTRTLTPKQAAKTRRVGACASLRGDVNGWRGGFGFWSNSRCNGGVGDRSFVQVAFSSRVPTAGVFSYGAYRVDTVGRANRSVPRSTGVIGLFRASDETFPKLTVMRSGYRSHPSNTLQGNTAVAPDGWVAWNVLTGKGNRWDVRKFTVRLAVKVLRKPTAGVAAQSPSISSGPTTGDTTLGFVPTR